LRFCLARIIAPRRTSPVELDLPPLDTQKDLALAVGKAVGGEITPAEASELARLVETARRAIEARPSSGRIISGAANAHRLHRRYRGRMPGSRIAIQSADERTTTVRASMTGGEAGRRGALPRSLRKTLRSPLPDLA
jgi:hypothetical protein